MRPSVKVESACLIKAFTLLAVNWCFRLSHCAKGAFMIEVCEVRYSGDIIPIYVGSSKIRQDGLKAKLVHERHERHERHEKSLGGYSGDIIPIIDNV